MSEEKFRVREHTFLFVPWKWSSQVVKRRTSRDQVLDLDEVYREHVQTLQQSIGQSVALSSSYTQGKQATLLSIEGETATIRFRNGATLSNVPLRDLVDDSAYWKSR